METNEEVVKEVVEVKQIDPEVEQEALRTGWTPKEQFKGDPEKWRPADEWVERGRSFIPFIKAEKRELETKYANLETELEKQKKMVERLVNVQSKYSDDFYETKIGELKEKKLKAVEDGDTETYKVLEEQQSKLTKPEPIKIDDEPEIPKATKEWIDKNDWFSKDQEMRDYAYFIGEQLKNNNDPVAIPGREAEFFAKIDERIKATFPHKFTNENQDRQDFDTGGTRGGDPPKPTGKTWNDLPEAAKQHFNNLKAQLEMSGHSITQEQYLKDYFEGE